MKKQKLYIFLDLGGVLSSLQLVDKLQANKDVLKKLHEWDTKKFIQMNESFIEKDKDGLILFGGSNGFGEYLENNIVTVFRNQIAKLTEWGYDVKIILVSSASDVIFPFEWQNKPVDETLRVYFSEKFGAEIIDGEGCSGGLKMRYRYMLNWLKKNINPTEDDYKAVIIDDIYDSYRIYGEEKSFYITDGFCGALTVKKDKEHALTHELTAMVVSGNCVSKANYEALYTLLN